MVYDIRLIMIIYLYNSNGLRHYVDYDYKLWKTMPGRVKLVPQDSTERDRTDTGH